MKNTLAKVIAFSLAFACLMLMYLTQNKNESITAMARLHTYERKYVWQFRPARQNVQPTFPETKSLFKQNKTICVGSADFKFIYLTYNVTIEDGGMDEILDTLRDKQVPAAFFVSQQYMRSNVRLVRRMAEEGHIVALRTDDRRELATMKEQSEIEQELAMVREEATRIGVETKNFVRPPGGVYSEKSLAFTANAGYTTVLWSFAYSDSRKRQPSPMAARRIILLNLHPGEIMLLHSHSSTNRRILPSIIDECKNLGYEFRSLDDFL